MDWWTGSSSSSSTATAAAAAAAAAASAAVVANDIGLPTGGFQHESNAFFDPWLNVGCDELDLSIILSHHHVHPHHNATPSSLHQMSPFCDSNNNNNNNNPSSPQTTTCSMINHTSSNNNNNNNSTSSSQLDQNPISKLQNIATETQSSHQQYRASINKNNGSLASSSTTFSSTSSSSNTTTTTSSSTSPDASSSLASALVDHSNHDDTCAGNRHQHIQQHHQQDKSIPCLLNDNNNDLSDGQMFSSSANDCKPLMSFGVNNKQPINHHNNRINPIFTNNNNNSSKQILKTNYNGRTATIGNNNQQSYLNCQTSVASPITSSPVSSSIELSPQNSVEISTTGISNACYLLGSNYSRPNVLSPISPSSMILSHQHNDQKGMELVRGDIGQQSESTRLLEGSFKVNLMHQNHSQPFEETSYCENQSLFRKSTCDSGEVQPYFNSNNRCHIGSLDTNECGCALGIASENNGSRQRIRNNLENLLHLASGTDDESNLKIRLDCSGLKVDSHQQAELQNNQQLSSALTPSHMHNEEQLGRGSSHTDDNDCHNARAQQNTTTRNNSMTQVENSRNNKTTTQSGGQKGSRLRRFRHITDYVLAEEEKRLLIKEGYTDFPMTSSPTRPLSRAEERILRKIRRKIRNKKSAQCSRQRKKEYVEELERKYTVVVRENEELKQLLKRFQQHAN